MQQEHIVCEALAHRFVLHDSSAALDDHRLACELLDIRQGLDERCGSLFVRWAGRLVRLAGWLVGRLVLLASRLAGLGFLVLCHQLVLMFSAM